MEKNSLVSEYMQELVTAGFVSRDFTWHLKSGLDSKLSHYRLKDNYLRFYLKYIEPNKKKIEKQGLKLLPQWQSAMGLQFENLVLGNRKAVQKILGIDPSEIINDNEINVVACEEIPLLPIPGDHAFLGKTYQTALTENIKEIRRYPGIYNATS